MVTTCRFAIICLCICFADVVSGQLPTVQFGPPSGNVFKDEITSIGSHLFTITVTNVPVNSNLDFTTLNDETRDLVHLQDQPSRTTVTTGYETWTVNVTLIAILDRDRSPAIRDLLFQVDGGRPTFTTQGRVKLIIRDSNDNPPLFVNLPYRVTLDEGTDKNNTVVYTVTATDPDDGPGGSVVFSMTADAQGADDTYNKTFVILNDNMGDITLARKLDYETRNYYQYKIHAKDRGNPACPGQGCKCSNVTEPNVNCDGEPATFIVTVRDVQDTPPFFERLPYITQVHENETMGASFYQVFARDGDTGVPNEITYSIVNETAYPFTINSSTGVLKVGQGLDADKPGGQRYVINVTASEIIRDPTTQGGDTNTTTSVSITVLDVNDNAPEFKESVYHATVQENTPNGVPLTMKSSIEVTDRDQNENNQFKLSVVQDEAPYNVCTTLPDPSTLIQGTTTVIIRVLNSSVLDYEAIQNLTFQLNATEINTSEQYWNVTTIVLTIEDMNDNSPIFVNNSMKEVNVTEHEKNGTVLATFNATDLDSGDYGTVHYSLEESLGEFAIDPVSGNLSVIDDLDRDPPGGRATYSLVIVATDNMAGDKNQRRSDRLNIRVTVLDINDNAPEFVKHPPFVTVQENASPGTALMTLTANDVDEGRNGDVEYRIVDVQHPGFPTSVPQDLFTVDPDSGVVSVNASLIGYPGNHILFFMASDHGDEPLNGTTNLTVRVDDVNTNEPVFVNPDENLLNTSAGIIPNVTVKEEEPVGSLIIELRATDKDTGQNGEVIYILDPDLALHFNSFSVNFSTGNLTNKFRLDRDREGGEMYQLNIRAEDRGSPRLSSVIPFRVYIRDINDNEPEFPVPRNLTLHVGEETKNVRVGFVNISIDKDQDPENKIACYYIYGGHMVDHFSLVKDTGELRLDSKLDRDQTPSVAVYVKVTGNCNRSEDHFITANVNNSFSSSDSSLLWVKVMVDDINDNPPVFDKDALTVGLLYDKDVGYEVINLAVYTYDNDTPEHSQNYFRLLQMKMPSNEKSPFDVSRNGSVTTNRLFGSDEIVSFVLEVQAYDRDNQSDTADLTIYLVSNVQRVKLVFDKAPNEVVEIKGELVTKLGEALGMTIIADKIATHITTSGTADPRRTDMYIHARYIPSGKIVPVNELWNAFDYNLDVRDIFQDLGVRETLPLLEEEKETDDNDVERAFIIVTVVLGLICLALVIVLFNAVRRYRRRLRAATTSAFVSKKEETNAYIPPGTNKYFAAENPLFGKDVKPTDVDRLDNDNDSLDDNAVDGKPSNGDKEVEEEQEMYLELYDEGNGPGVHVNHLAMVLQEYERENAGPQEGDSSPPPYLSPTSHDDDPSDRWKSSLNGHVKSDSGFNEQSPYNHGLQQLQYTDI